MPPTPNNPSQEDEIKIKEFQSNASIIAVSIFIILGIAYFGILLYLLFWNGNASLAESIYSNARSLFGLPFAAFGSFVLVRLIEITSGQPIKFKGFGFEFEGASGPAIFWVVFFLAICGAIKALQ